MPKKPTNRLSPRTAVSMRDCGITLKLGEATSTRLPHWVEPKSRPRIHKVAVPKPSTSGQKLAKNSSSLKITPGQVVALVIVFSLLLHIFDDENGQTSSQSQSSQSAAPRHPWSSPGDQWSSTPAAADTARPAKPRPSERVRKTQHLLLSLGFDPGPADGLLGKKTIQAIKRFQKKMNMPQTGRIDDELISNLVLLTPDSRYRKQ